MRRICLVMALGTALSGSMGLAQQAPTAGPYKVLKTARVGGAGGFDYVYADVAGRRLYIARTGTSPTAISRIDRNGNSSGSVVSGARICRAHGPHNAKHAHRDVTSLSRTEPSDGR